jgi:hypothetical protein
MVKKLIMVFLMVTMMIISSSSVMAQNSTSYI